ncbi:hypothetical protein FRC11_005587 [Ceratobasidium sp. 423]|nr:hypothetical protein FRC11_005587 [Ceratobasidium sp. 423]
MHEMFFNTSLALNLAKEVYGMNKDERTQHCASCAKKKRLLAVVEELMQLDPMLIDRLLSAGAGARRAVNREAQISLSKGQSNGRSEDMRKISWLLQDIRTWNAPVINKEDRGLGHSDCAYLLSPADLDWEDASAREDFISGKTRSSPNRWFRACWRDEKYNSARPSDGLLYSKILTDAGTAILLSRSSVPTENNTQSTLRVSGARGRKSGRRTAKGLAKRYQICRVTTSFIAYVVVCVRHSLTDDPEFHPIVNGFNYNKLYDSIKTYLEAPTFASRAKELIKHWNETIFKGIYFGPEETEESLEGGTLASLMAEVEADGDTSQPGVVDQTV